MSNADADDSVSEPYVAGSGPADLAARVISGKQQLVPLIKMRSQMALSDESIQQLIDLAFQASLLEEEGRFPRFRILAGTYRLSRYYVDFGPFPFPIDHVESLRKLAPAAADREVALHFGERSLYGNTRGLHCYGICDTEDMLFDTGHINSLSLDEINVMTGAPVLVVRVEDPGYLKAGFLPGQIHSLRGGTIRELQSYDTVTCVAELFRYLGEWQYTELTRFDDGRVAAYFNGPNVCSKIMMELWSQVLWYVANQRHGGAFLVIPVEDGHDRHPGQYKINCDFPGSISLSQALLDHVELCLNQSPTEGPKHLVVFRLIWRMWRQKFFRIAKMVADLANVDGCVVLDRRLRVCGFGGKINVDTKPMKESGTRHASASAWCEEVGGIAFVVSQDGDLRVFPNTHPATPLDAWRRLVDVT